MRTTGTFHDFSPKVTINIPTKGEILPAGLITSLFTAPGLTDVGGHVPYVYKKITVIYSNFISGIDRVLLEVRQVLVYLIFIYSWV